MARNLNTVFGDSPRRTWDSFRRLLYSYLSRRFPSAQAADVEDIVGDALLDLCDYWATVPSSMSEDVERNWNYATWRATRRSSTLMYAFLQAAGQAVSLDAVLQHGDEHNGGEIGAQSSLTPAERAASVVLERMSVNGPEFPTDQDYQRRIQTAVDRIPTTEFQEWLQAALDGESVRETGRKQGKGHVQVHRQRQRGKARLVAHFSSYGVTVTV